MKKFYSHLIEIESLIIELDKLNLTGTERKHLANLVDANLHHTIMDAILSQLSEEDKKTFMQILHQKVNEKIWDFLNSKVDNIEDKIKKAAKDLKTQLHKDLREAKKIGT